MRDRSPPDPSRTVPGAPPVSATAEAFFRKLTTVVRLEARDRSALEAALGGPARVRPGVILMREGEPTPGGFVLAAGWAIRERLLNDGRRQVIGFMLPGDASTPGVFVGEVADHTVTALTEATILRFTHPAWATAARSSGRVAAALWWLTAHEAALRQEHIVALGRRSARERILYLVWETWRRLQLVGLAGSGTFDLPVSYEVLADATGMTPRHLGRVLAGLHEEGVFRFKNGVLTILDPDRLTDACDCRDELLHLVPVPEGVRRALDAEPPPPPAENGDTGGENRGDSGASRR